MQFDIELPWSWNCLDLLSNLRKQVEHKQKLMTFLFVWRQLWSNDIDTETRSGYLRYWLIVVQTISTPIDATESN